MTDPDGWDEFWSVYPLKVAKLAAKKAYQRALKSASPSDILAGVKKYRADRRGTDKQFTKHPATWLNGGCWMDTLSETREGFEHIVYVDPRMG